MKHLTPDPIIPVISYVYLLLEVEPTPVDYRAIHDSLCALFRRARSQHPSVRVIHFQFSSGVIWELRHDEEIGESARQCKEELLSDLDDYEVEVMHDGTHEYTL